MNDPRGCSRSDAAGSLLVQAVAVGGIPRLLLGASLLSMPIMQAWAYEI